MNKRQAVEYCYHEGYSAEEAFDKMWPKFNDLTLEWVKEVYEELDS